MKKIKSIVSCVMIFAVFISLSVGNISASEAPNQNNKDYGTLISDETTSTKDEYGNDVIERTGVYKADGLHRAQSEKYIMVKSYTVNCGAVHNTLMVIRVEADFYKDTDRKVVDFGGYAVDYYDVHERVASYENTDATYNKNETAIVPWAEVTAKFHIIENHGTAGTSIGTKTYSPSITIRFRYDYQPA